MRKLLILLLLILTATIVWACGDKLMLVMGVRLSQLKPTHPAAILAYPQQNLPSAALIRQIQLHPAVKKAGHKFQLVEDLGRLDDALSTGKYDLVLADVSVADDLTQRVRSAPSRPVVLPVAYNATKAAQSATQKKFHCLLKAPSDSEHYLLAIDQAMDWKAKTLAR